MTPDLRTISGFAPKFSNSYRTRSASFPTLTAPTYLLRGRCGIALTYTGQADTTKQVNARGIHGLIVSLALYLSTLPLPHIGESPAVPYKSLSSSWCATSARQSPRHSSLPANPSSRPCLCCEARFVPRLSQRR